jgi:hypothetical protein
MQEIHAERILPIQQEMQVRSWISGIKKGQ